ncbi:MAG: Gfo/Idh/MocA family oxidoreductase [Rhodospirillales bacterium]|nr:Gfo/Idh/MocA family oxidoreductase [Rhodospirillales bacterium]
MPSTAIIGAGAIAHCHAEALTRLGVRIAGVLDADPDTARRFAARYAVPVITDLAAAVRGLDMVHICTPPAYRIAYAQVAMQAGCHVVMEKPMAITVADGETLVEMARASGVRLMIDFNHRFRAGFQALLDVVRSGAIGEVVSIHVQRMGMLGGNAGTRNDTWRRNPRSACGMSIESLSHDIDMIMQLAGPIASVQAETRATLADAPTFDTDVNAVFALAGGAMAGINATWSSWLKSSARSVVGTKGSAILEGGDLFDFARLRLRTAQMPHEQVTRLDDIYNFATCPSYLAINRHFIACMQSGADSGASGEHALETLKVSHAILAAAAGRTMVRL